MNFQPTVSVVTLSGEHVYQTHAAHARALCSVGVAKRKSKKCIELLNTVDGSKAEPTLFMSRSWKATKTVDVQRPEPCPNHQHAELCACGGSGAVMRIAGRYLDLRHIPAEDAYAFTQRHQQEAR